jgi:signal transduction histidine kinase
VPVSRLRLGAAAAGLSLALAVVGVAREVSRFGWTDSGGVSRLQRDLERRLAEQARALENMAHRVARDATLVAAADASPDAIPDLFASLSRSLPGDNDSLSSTIWVPVGPAGGYRVLAWSGGPAEDVAPDILATAPALAIVPGAGGLRLVFVQPILHEKQRIGVAASETVIAADSRVAALTRTYVMPSSLGPVVVAPTGTEALDYADHLRLRIAGPGGTPMLDASISPEQLAGGRRVFRWRAAALALSPWLIWLLLGAMACLERRGSARGAAAWAAWTAAGGVLIGGAAIVVIYLGRAAEAPEAWIQLARALTALALAGIIPGSAWWRRTQRAIPARARVRWIAENLAGGGVVAFGLVAMASIWRDRLNPTSLENWQLPALASDVTSLAALCAVLVMQIAVSWAMAGTLAVLAARWRITGRRLEDWLGALMWTLPAIVVAEMQARSEALPLPATAVIVLSATAFGLISLAIRRHYRATSEARRLVLRFVALFVPVVVVYPLAAASAERATRAVIEGNYGPATLAAQQPVALMSVLTQAEEEIDAIPQLASLLVPNPGANVPTSAAFTAWAQTVLSRERVTSEIELYGSDRRLVSRFSLNVPEFVASYQSGEVVWQGTGCKWDSFAEVARFGANDQALLHAERAICSPDGTILGAVVLHLIPDYRALPFVSTANPYYEALGRLPRSRAATGQIADLQLVVYGWSLHPVFISGRVAWPIDEEIDALLEQSREPFWRDRVASNRRFHIFFQNDRARIYALGYPAATGVQHVTRLTEAAALLAALFVAYLVATAVAGPLWRSRPTALRRLFHEIRASFYRKLFLFFVLAAVGPVVLFAIAFGAYTTGKLRADVESEAATVAIVARRVFDELSAAQAPPGQARLGPSDDMMVWIRQMVDQDVNLYDGAHLTATSQRDLFDSGLLTKRTPASVYREIVLGRRPVAVAEDRIGTLRYLVAATEVPAFGRDAVLTVPLASRQREIEREIDDLTRGVLAAAVLLVVFAAALGASVAARVSDPVARLTRATRQIAAGRLDDRLVADSADELGRLVEDFNTMSETLLQQRAELARANQVKAWAEMSRQVAHEVKNPLTPIQLAAEHLQRVHDDGGRPLGTVADQCLTTILKQVRLLRRIASEFSTFATQPVARLESVALNDVVISVLEPYRAGLPENVTLDVALDRQLPAIRCDRTQIARALTNLVENALQAMPNGGRLSVTTRQASHDRVEVQVSDTGVGMDEEGARRAFEPYFSTKTGGSGLGLANAKRNIESSGGTIALTSRAGQGTVVSVTLPAVLPASSASESRPSQ